MIRHMVLFRFREEASPQSRADVLRKLQALPERYSTMQRFGIGENISKRDKRFSHVMTIEFETQTELESYLDSEDHETFVREHFKPSVEERAIASYTC